MRTTKPAEAKMCQEEIGESQLSQRSPPQPLRLREAFFSFGGAFADPDLLLIQPWAAVLQEPIGRRGAVLPAED
jgi:hypothetical protein